MRAAKLALIAAPLLLIPGAAANVVDLPTGNFSCGLFSTPLFGDSLLQGCSGSATPFSSPAVPGIQGVSLGMSAPVAWTVAGSETLNPNSQIASPNPGGSELQVGDVIMTTEGIVGGSGSFSGFLPLNYDFFISPVGSPSCTTTNPCDVGVDWSLYMYLTGPAVSNPDGVLGILASGSGTGEFSGSAMFPTPTGLGLGSLFPATVSSGLDLTVYSDLRLTAILPSDGVASFSLNVPEGASFDFQSAADAPEPGTIVLCGAALSMLGLLRRKRYSD